MRLVELEMAGFGAFRDYTQLEFDDIDFFALVGPTGSGKSTIIDAVCFALYGAVPRYEDQRLNRYVITLGSSEAKVVLTFELDGVRHIAARVVRRNNRGQVSTREARLERVEADGTTTSLAGTEREMNQAVEGLLRLNFHDFTRCVVLPQGEFSQFLRAKGDDRRDLLVRLLNLDIYLKVGQRAGQVAETAKMTAELHRQRQMELAFATPEALDEAVKKTKALTQLTEEAKRTRPKVDEENRLAEDEERRSSESARLAGLLEKIAVPEEARQHGAKQADAEQALREAQAALNTARHTRQELQAEAQKLPDPVALSRAAEAHDRLEDNSHDLAGAQACEEKAKEEEHKVAQAVADAEDALATATAHLEDLRRAHQAADLAQRLIVGQPCPVCERVVESVPEHVVPETLPKAQAAETAAQEKLTAVRGKHTAAVSTLAVCGTQMATLEAERERLLGRVTDYPDVEVLGQLIDTVQNKRLALTTARGVEDEWVETSQKKQEAVEKLAAEMPAFQGLFDTQRDTVAVLNPPEATHVDLVGDWETLASWAKGANVTQSGLSLKAAAQAQAHRENAKDLVDKLIIRCKALGVTPKEDIIDVLTALSEATVEAGGHRTAMEEAIEENKALADKIAQLEEEAGVASTLRGLLRADHFPEWLISEALELLVADASATLRSLTNEAFSLALGDKEFAIIDHANADEMRPARTLSGGETFQASLALALALSDQIRGLAADGAPRLDALFLDEGFGTLDPETLDTVAGTIENLGQSGRMVGIISHVRELAARVPVRFEVRKGPRSATVEKIYS